jgi:MipA family protein
MYLCRTIAVALLIFFFLPAMGSGQEQKPVWELVVGAGLMDIPHYRGADQSRFYGLPYPYIVYRGDVISMEKQTIYGRIFKTDRVLLDVSYYGSLPVDSDDNDARAEMPDLDATLEVGPALNIMLAEDREEQWVLKLQLPVRPVFSTDFSSITYEGGLISPRLRFEKDDIIPGAGVAAGISAGPVFANAGYHDYYYTVKPAYATQTRPAYKAGSGYSGSEFTISLSKSFKRVKITAFARADVLNGAVFEDSPLVKTKTSIISGISVSWLFLKSARMVTTDILEEMGRHIETGI